MQKEEYKAIAEEVRKMTRKVVKDVYENIKRRYEINIDEKTVIEAVEKVLISQILNENREIVLEWFSNAKAASVLNKEEDEVEVLCFTSSFEAEFALVYDKEDKKIKAVIIVYAGYGGETDFKEMLEIAVLNYIGYYEKLLKM